MSDEPKPRATDEQLTHLATWDHVPAVQLAAQELLSRRARDRADSRRAGQLRKLRWSIEHVLTKLGFANRSQIATWVAAEMSTAGE